MKIIKTGELTKIEITHLELRIMIDSGNPKIRQCADEILTMLETINYPLISTDKSCEQKCLDDSAKIIMESQTPLWFDIVLAFIVISFFCFLLYLMSGLTGV